ncbi:MAG: hypothetical protein KA134_02555, partial [Achromobacter sp.]|nr:hypothetical protein [Achromobacter sp.]
PQGLRQRGGNVVLRAGHRGRAQAGRVGKSVAWCMFNLIDGSLRCLYAGMPVKPGSNRHVCCNRRERRMGIALAGSRIVDTGARILGTSTGPGRIRPPRPTWETSNA